MLAKHKKGCLSLNGDQSGRLKKGAIEFENYFKQVSFDKLIFSVI